MSTRQNRESNLPLEDPYVRKLVSLCDMHRVSFGSPTDLAGFMRALEDNKHLAMDFWAMVARMAEEEGGDSGNERILEAVAQSVAGRSVAEIKRTGGEESRLVGELASLLAGEDIHRPMVESAAVNEADKVVKEDAAEPSSPTVVADPLREEAATPTTSFREEPVVLPNLQTERRENRRIVLQPEPAVLPPVSKSPFLKVSFAKEDDRDIPIPLAAYADRNPEQRSITIGLVLLLMIFVGAGVFVAQRYGPGWWERYGPTARELLASKNRGGERSGNGSASTSAVSASSPAPSSSSLNTGDDRQTGDGVAAPHSSVVPTAPQTSTPQRARPEGKQPAAPVVRQPPPVARAQVEREAAVAARARRRVVEEDDESGATEAGPGAPVAVGPAVMQANLISSRLPAYPEAAKARGLEGRVVMQAIVSKSGTIGHLRVISGDPVLRSAAAEAVSTWRYRPYLVNGQPVDVTTLVSVDFKLNP